ncbi:adenylate/guanylate cyclase domain-containing protein [Winogradskyella sp. DF17]|uniref:Adenylate/guanylate cyclase domain-containing protein n=1 Tax=Winogradskyella pelagia TaxID=2819984 RepID=A0ABS3T7F3_9FLAO|nr:adenylate/guanylate cyclase domain-containing protein [Winogradskyella sp. DF17]MBO3117685.1 adenylate/guanylate cyclase domain-containing protein [Winogradskyella sp. DF17]
MNLKKIATTVVICLVFAVLTAQNKTKADSLEQIYLTKSLSVEEELDVLGKLAQYSPDIDKGLKYSEKLLQLARSQNSIDDQLQALLQKGNSLTRKGDLSLALQTYLEGVKIADSSKKQELLGASYIAIAGVYSVMDNKENTIGYYRKAIKVLEDLPNKLVYASALENLGDEYNLNLGQPDSALYYFEQSGKIFNELNNKLGIAYNLGNKGLAYAQKRQTKLAESNINEAMVLLAELGDYYAISSYLAYMSDIFLVKGDYDTANFYAQNSLDMAQQNGLKDQISEAYLKLSEIAEAKTENGLALDLYKSHIRYRDSVKNITVAQKLAKQTREAELQKKQNLLDLSAEREKKQQVIVLATAICLLLIGLLAFGLYRRTIFISKSKKLIEAERNRSDELLLNILPEQTANELKLSGKVDAKRYEEVTILFSDFKGFTSYSEKLTPEKVVKTIGFYFSEFDKIIEKYNLEKIKTIGDAYMCASGLPRPNKNHAYDIASAALEMIDFINSVKSNGSEDFNFDIRIGINSGPVVAGVVGTKKFAYDIWGDAVNIASRMESSSQINKINISEATYTKIKDHFECEYRGELDVKNKGQLRMYFVNSKKLT